MSRLTSKSYGKALVTITKEHIASHANLCSSTKPVV